MTLKNFTKSGLMVAGLVLVPLSATFAQAPVQDHSSLNALVQQTQDLKALAEKGASTGRQVAAEPTKGDPALENDREAEEWLLTLQLLAARLNLPVVGGDLDRDTKPAKVKAAESVQQDARQPSNSATK